VIDSITAPDLFTCVETLLIDDQTGHPDGTVSH